MHTAPTQALACWQWLGIHRRIVQPVPEPFSLQAGWESASMVNTRHLEVMYQSPRSTRFFPSPAEEQAANSCGGVPVEYQIVTASVGLGKGQG